MPTSLAEDDDITTAEAPTWRRSTKPLITAGRIAARQQSGYLLPFHDSSISIAQPPDADEPSWLLPSLRALDEIGWLPENWNSYGAKPVAVEAAVATLRLMAAMMTDATPLPAFVPTQSGGIQLEWHVRGIDLEIDVRPTRRLFASFEDHRTTEEWEAEITSDLRRLRDVLPRLMRP